MVVALKKLLSGARTMYELNRVYYNINLTLGHIVVSLISALCVCTCVCVCVCVERGDQYTIHVVKSVYI